MKIDNKAILEFHCPRFNELPKVDLYKEQVIKYVEDVLGVISITLDERILSPSMLNNYVKQRVVSPPKDKKYNDEHLAYLIIVCTLKQIFSLQDIYDLIRRQIEVCPIDYVYDLFCTELEVALKSVFATKDFSQLSSIAEVTYEGELVRASVMSFVNKIYIQNYLRK